MPCLLRSRFPLLTTSPRRVRCGRFAGMVDVTMENFQDVVVAGSCKVGG
jgi:hypothetical protein